MLSLQLNEPRIICDYEQPDEILTSQKNILEIQSFLLKERAESHSINPPRATVSPQTISSKFKSIWAFSILTFSSKHCQS
jgi:hypothetical protein